MAPPPPRPTHILETILYVRNMVLSLDFYTNTLGLQCVHSNDRNAVFPLGAGVLLLFQLGLTTEDVEMGNDQGIIPKHGPTEPLLPYLQQKEASDNSQISSSSSSSNLTIGGERLRQHFCFAVDSAADVDTWDEHLKAKGVEILGRVRWPGERGRSVYFADPDGNVGEVASRGIWDHLRKGA